MPRSSNKCADVAANWARIFKCNIATTDCFLDRLSPEFLNCVTEDRTGCSPLV